MRKSLLWMVVGAAIALSGASAVLAQMQAPGAAPGASSAGASAPIRGSIASLDLSAQPPTLKLTDEKGKSVTLQVDPQATTVEQDGRAAKLQDLKPGQTVEVEQAMKNGKPIAKSIEVLSVGGAGAAPSPSRSPSAPQQPSTPSPRQPQQP